MTSWNLQPWQLKATCKAINTADSTVTTNASSSYYHLNIDYNPTQEIVQLNFVPPAKQAKQEIENKNRNTDKDYSKANQICKEDMFKQRHVPHDTSDKSVQVPSTLLGDGKQRKHSRKEKSRSSVVEQLAVTESVNTNTVCEHDFTVQKDLTLQKNTGATCHLEKKKKHRHGRRHSQDTLTITDVFSMKHSPTIPTKSKTKKHRPRGECDQTVPISKGTARENCEDPIFESASQKCKHKECSEETLTITGTFSQANFKDRVKATKIVKEAVPENTKESKDVCAKHKKKSKRRKEKLIAEPTQQEQLQSVIADYEMISGQNAQLYYVKSTLENPFDVPVLRKKSKDSVIKPIATKTKRRRKAHLSLETKFEDIQNTTSSSSGRCKSQETAAVKEALPTEKKEGIKFFFIRNKKNIKEDQKKSNISKGSKIEEGTNHKHGTKGNQLSDRNDFADAEDVKERSKKATASQQNETVNSSVNKNRSKSVDAKTFKKHVHRDSLETLHYARDTKLNKKHKTIRGSIQEESDLGALQSYTKRQSKSETNIKQAEVGTAILKTTKENLVGDQKSSKKGSNINKQKNEKNDLKVKNKSVGAEAQENNVKVEGTSMIDKLFHKTRSNKNKQKCTDATTETRSLKNWKDPSKNEKFQIELENEIKTPHNKVNLNATNSTDAQDPTACEKCKKRKRSKKGTETIQSGERKLSKHKIIEAVGTVEDVLDKKHKKSKKSEIHHHRLHATTETVSPKTSEENQKKEVPDLFMDSKDVQRKSRRRSENAGLVKPKPENTSKSTVHDQSASATDNSVVVYRLATERNCFSGIKSNDKQFVKETEEDKKSSDSKKIIKIRKEQLEAIINQINKKHNLQQSKTLHYKLPSTEEKSSELRKEVSFSQLNLQPVVAYYASPMATLNLEEKHFESISAYNSTLSFPTKEKKQTKPKKKTKVTDHNSVVSEAVTKKEKFQYVCGQRYSTNRAARNFAYPESIFESSRKALLENNSSTIGFTVEGIEPPRMLKPSGTKQSGPIQKELRVVVVSVVAIPPKYEEGLSCSVNHSLIPKGKKIRRSLSLLNTADEDFVEGAELSDISEKEQLPHAQTFTSLVSAKSRAASRKCSANHKLSLKSQGDVHAIEDIDLNDNTVIDFSGKNCVTPESSLGIFEQLENTTCGGRMDQEKAGEDINPRMFGNRDLFAEEDLDKEQFAALGQEVFNRMRQYLKILHKLPDEKRMNEFSRKATEKQQPSGTDQISRMYNYAEELAEKRRRLSRGSSSSSKRSLASSKDKTLEKKDTKRSLSNDANRRSLSRNSLNNSIYSRSISSKRDLTVPVRDRSDYLSNRTGSTSRKEGCMNSTNKEKDYKTGSASRENSDSHRSRSSRPTTPLTDPTTSSKPKRSILTRLTSVERRSKKSEDFVAKSNVYRDTSNESLPSKSKQKHASLYDRLILKSKRKSSLSRERNSVERKQLESEKASKIPRRISKESRKSTKSPSSDRDSSIERKNKRQREKSAGSTSSELSTKDCHGRSSISRTTKEKASWKTQTLDDSKKVKMLKGVRSLQPSETFLCDSFSGEFDNAPKEEEYITSEDVATALAKITEETPSENSLNVTYSQLPEKLENKGMTSNLNKHLKQFKYTPEELELMKPLLSSSIAKALKKKTQEESVKHKSAPSKKVAIDEKSEDEMDKHLQYVSKDMFDNILGILNLNNKTEGNRHFLFSGNIPVSDHGGTEKSVSKKDNHTKHLSKMNTLPKEIININSYYEDGNLQKGKTDTKKNKDPLILINFSNTDMRQTKAQQDRAPEIICSSCSINAQQNYSDFESGMWKTLDNKPRKPVFNHNHNNDPPENLPRKQILTSDDSMENNPAAKCKLSSCIPKIKSKIPLRKDGESGKSVLKCKECQMTVHIEKSPKSTKINDKWDKSGNRNEEVDNQNKAERNQPRQDVQLRNTLEKRTKQNTFPMQVIGKNQYNEKLDQAIRCTDSDCAKMTENYICERENQRTMQKVETTQKLGESQIKEKDNQPKRCNNSNCLKMIDNFTDEQENHRTMQTAEGTEKRPGEKSGQSKLCNSSNCLKMIENYIQEKQHVLNVESINENSMPNTKQKRPYGKSQIGEDYGQEQQYNNSEGLKIIGGDTGNGLKPQHTDVKPAPEDVDIEEVQRLSHLVKQNVMKELEAAHLLKPMMMNQNTKKQKQLDGIIERSIASALSQRACSMMCSVDIDESVLDTREPRNTQYGELSANVMGTNQQIVQEHRPVTSENMKSNAQNAALRKANDQKYSLKFNQNKNRQNELETEAKRDDLLEKLTFMISNEQDFLHFESRLDKLLGIQRVITPTTTNEAVLAHHCENCTIPDEGGSPVVMNVQTVKNPVNNKKANHVGYTVPARKCKVKRSRLKMNSSQEINSKGKTADVTLSNTSKTSETLKKEIKNKSNPFARNISKIPTLIKPTSKKHVPKLPNTSEIYTSKTKNANKNFKSATEPIEENSPAQSAGDLQESNTSKFCSNLMEMEIVERSENQTNTNSSSKLVNSKAKLKTSTCSNATSGRALSAYEKRKLYGESLRSKKTISKNDPALTSFTESEKGTNEDCIYCYPQHGSVDLEMQKQSKEEVPKFSHKHHETSKFKQHDESPSGSYSYRSPGTVGDNEDSNADLNSYVCIERCFNDEEKNKTPARYPTMSSINKPSGSGRNLKQNFQRKSDPDERAKRKEREERIYQAYSVLADHPNVTDVFRNQFKAESSVSLFSGESTFSCDNVSPCISPRSNCSLNTIRDRTLHKSSSLLMEEIHNQYGETKRLNNYKTMGKAHRGRKKSSMGATTTRKLFCNPSKEVFGTMKQKLNDYDDIPGIPPLNLTSSYEFYHSTPDYMRKMENVVEENVPFHSRSSRIPDRKDSLLETCQHLRNNSLSGRRRNKYVNTHVYEKSGDVNNVSRNAPNTNNFYEEIEGKVADKSSKRNKYRNFNRKTFFKDTKSLIYQSLEKTSKTLGNSSRKTSSLPYSCMSGQHHQENVFTPSDQSECDLTLSQVELDALKHFFDKHYRNISKTKTDVKNMASRVRKTATVKTVKPSASHGHNKNVKLYSLRDLSDKINKTKHHKMKSPTLKRWRNDNEKDTDDDKQRAAMRIPSLTSFREGLFRKGRRSCSGNGNSLRSSKDEEGSYTIFKLDKDFQIHRKHKLDLDKNQSEECFKIFAYNNIIELDMDYPLLYSTGTNNGYANNSFLFSNMEKSKLFPRSVVHKTEQLTKHKKEDRASSASVTPTSEKTESGYGSSCKSKKSRPLRKFFPQQNLLDTFTSTFRCFDQEVYVGKRVTTFPVNTSTYSKTCSRPQSDSCPTDYESRPNSSRRRNRTLSKDNSSASDYSAIPNDAYKYEQPSTSKFRSNRFGRVERPVSYLYNVGIERYDSSANQERLQDISNQNKRSSSNQYDKHSVKFKVDMERPSSAEDRKLPESKLYGRHRYEESETDSDNKQFRSRIPQKLKTQYRHKDEELAEQFSSVSDKHKPFLSLKQKFTKNYGRKQDQYISGSNTLKADEEEHILKYRHAYEYQEPEDHTFSKYGLLRRRRLASFSETDESVEQSRGRCKRLCNNDSDSWQSEPTYCTSGRFKELIRTISRPFHTSRKLDQDAMEPEEQTSVCTVSTKDSESNQRYWFRNNKNRKANSDLTSKPSEMSLRDIAVGVSDTRCGRTQTLKSLQKQVDQCHEFVNKVCNESRLRKEGHLKQFTDFKEIPLSILLGKKAPNYTDSGKTNSSSCNRTSRPKLKVLDNSHDSKEVLELKSLSEDESDKLSYQKLADKFKKMYLHNELDDVNTLQSKPKPGKKYTEEVYKALRCLLENCECKKETCEVLRNFLRKSECTRETYNDLRNALKESECTEETCKNLRLLLKKLREAFLEGTEGASVNLKNVPKESILPLKDLLDMGFQKLLANPDEDGPLNELSTELMRLPSDTSSVTTSSQYSMKELLDLPFSETIQADNNLSQDSVMPLRELLDKVFGEIISSSSKNSKPSTHFIKSPLAETSHSFLNKSDHSPSDYAFTESLNVPLIKLSKSPGHTSLTNSSCRPDMESARMEKSTQKEVEVDASALPKSLKEFIPELYTGYQQPAFSQLSNLSNESKELLQVTLQKVLSHSKESLMMLSKGYDTLPGSSLKEPLKQTVERPLQFLPSTSRDARKSTNKSTSSYLTESHKSPVDSVKDNHYSHSTKTTKDLHGLSKESKELLEDIFQKLLYLSKDTANASLKKFVALPTEYSLKNSEILTGMSKLSSSEHSEKSWSNLNRLSEGIFPKEALQRVFNFSTESDTLLNTASNGNSPSFSKPSDECLRSMESKETFEAHSKQDSQSELSWNIPSPSENLLKELLQFNVKVSSNPPLHECTKCSTRSNTKSVENSPNQTMKETTSLKMSLEDLFKESPNILLCVCKYLMGTMKEPLSTIPKEAIIQILKSLADNMSKESKEDLYPNIQNLFKKTELGEVQPTESNEQELLYENLEETVDSSVKSPSIQVSSGFLTSSANSPLKEKHTPAKPLRTPYLECSKCKKLANISKQQVNTIVKNISTEVRPSQSKASTEENPDSAQSVYQDAKDVLPSPFSGCTKSTCKRYAKRPKKLMDVPNTSSPGSSNDESNNLPEKSKEMLEEVVQKLINLSEEAATSKEMLKGVLSLSEEMGGSREIAVLPQNDPLDEPSHNITETASNLPFTSCTKATCSKLKRLLNEPGGIASKGTTVQVDRSRSPTSTKKSHCTKSTCANLLKSLRECADEPPEEAAVPVLDSGSINDTSSVQIGRTPAGSKNMSINRESRRLLETPPKCTKSTCPFMINSKESVDLSPKEAPNEIGVSTDSQQSLKIPLQCTKSTCTNYAKIPVGSTESSPKEASVKIIDKSSMKAIAPNDDVSAFEDAQSTVKLSVNGESPYSLRTSLQCTKSTCMNYYKIPQQSSKEASAKVRDSSPKNVVASTDAEISLKGDSQHSRYTSLKCTKSTCTNFAKIPKESSGLSPEQKSLQVLGPEPSTSLKGTPASEVEIPLKEEPQVPLQCTRSTCTNFVKNLNESADVPSEKELIHGLNSESPSGIRPPSKVKIPLQCNRSTCTNFAKEASVQVVTLKSSSTESTSRSIKSSKLSRELLGKVDEQLSTTPSRETLEETFVKLVSLSEGTIELEETPTTENAALPTTPSKEIVGTLDTTSERQDSISNKLQYSRQLSKESREFLEDTLINLIKVSKTSLTTLSEKPSQGAESLVKEIINKLLQDAVQKPPNLPRAGCECPLPNSATNIPEELETTLKNLMKVSKPSLATLAEEPFQESESLVKDNKILQDAVQGPSNLPRPCPLPDSTEEISQKISLLSEKPSNKPSNIEEMNDLKLSHELSEPSQMIAETPLANADSICTCETCPPHCTCLACKSDEEQENETNLSVGSCACGLSNDPSLLAEPFLETTPVELVQKANEDKLLPGSEQNTKVFQKQSQLVGNNSNARPTCWCEMDEESKELLNISLQNSTTQNAGKKESVDQQTPECACDEFARLSQQSVELANTIFSNFVESSEQSFNVQTNEQPHIMASFSGTSSTGQIQGLTNELSKYLSTDLGQFPKQSEEFLVAFHNIVNAGAGQTNMSLEDVPNKLPSPPKKMCKAKCKDPSGVPEELFKQLCDVTLTTMMELYLKVSKNTDMKISFKALVEELCRSKLREGNLSDVSTQSQLNVLQLMQNYTECVCPKSKANIEEKTENEIESSTSPTINEREHKDSPLQSKTEEQKIPPVDKPEPKTLISTEEDLTKPLETEIAPDTISVKSTITISKAEDVTLKSEPSFIDLEFKNVFGQVEPTSLPQEQKNALKELRDSLTDKELFEKLLDSYEKEENIVERLSKDDEFFQSQLELVKSKESVESLLKAKAEITRRSEQQLLAALNLGSFSELDEPKQPRKFSSLPSPKSVESTEVTGKRPSKSKISGFKSRMAKLFKSDAVKEIVAPRADGYKNSVDVSYLGRNSESYTDMDEEEAELGRRNSSNQDLQTEDSQKVKFIGQRFHEEKIMIAEDITSKTPRSSIESMSNVVKPTDLGKCFLRGFRSDYVSLGGDTCLLISDQEKERAMQQRNESYIEFSERDTPLEFLLALGFSIDEASNAIKDEDVKNRLFAAITEARIWINKISTVQGTLLYLIAYKAKPRIMRYYLQLVEAIINRRIQNAVKLDAFLRVLEKVEDGDLTMVNIIGSDKFDDEENEEKVVKKQLRQLFINVYKTAENEAILRNKPLSKEAIVLLRILAAKYRAGLHPHLELIARYIGQGLLRNEVQLEAAMIYLSRLDTADVNLNEFEQYCGITCKENKTSGTGTKLS